MSRKAALLNMSLGIRIYEKYMQIAGANSNKIKEKKWSKCKGFTGKVMLKERAKFSSYLKLSKRGKIWAFGAIF